MMTNILIKKGEKSFFIVNFSTATGYTAPKQQQGKNFSVFCWCLEIIHILLLHVVSTDSIKEVTVYK